MKATKRKKIIKNKYVIVLDYCIPLVNMVSTDVAVNNVKVTDKSGKILIDNMSPNTTDAYSDFTDVRVMKMTYGASYDLTIDRKSTSNTVNYKTWIDWNIDGDFDDANEEVLSSGPITGSTATSKIVVPALANSFEGKTRMRVGVSYGSFANTPCGVNQVGEFEDYAIQLANKGWKKACADSNELKLGLNVISGKVVYKGVAEAFNLEYTEVDSFLN